MQEQLPRRAPQRMASPFQGAQSLPLLLAPLTYIRVGHTADGGFTSCPKGDAQMPQSCVPALAKGVTIRGGLRLVLRHLWVSKSANSLIHYTSIGEYL